MLLEGRTYKRSEYRDNVGREIYGIQKDILKDRYAPDAEYADFFMAESLNKAFVHLVRTVPDESFFGKLTGAKLIKIVKTLTKEEYSLI